MAVQANHASGFTINKQCVVGIGTATGVDKVLRSEMQRRVRRIQWLGVGMGV